jgi:hypothetical protein
MHTLRPKRTLAIHPLESLEDRLVLSSVSLRPAAVAAQEALVTTKGGPALGAIYQEFVAFEKSGAHGTFNSPQAGQIVIKGTSVGVDVHVSGTFKADVKQLQGLGMKVTATSQQNGIIEGSLPIAQLPTVAGSKYDVGITPIYKPTTFGTATPASSPGSPTTVVADKGGPALASIYQEYLNYEQAGGTGTFSPPEAKQIIIKGTSVGVDIRVTGNLAASVALFQNLGMQVTATAVAGQVGIIEGELPIFQLPTVAGDASVVGLGPIYKPTLR